MNIDELKRLLDFAPMLRARVEGGEIVFTYAPVEGAPDDAAPQVAAAAVNALPALLALVDSARERRHELPGAVYAALVAADNL